MAERGVFITFEGGEGTGKTTQFNRLTEHLRAAGVNLVVTREPGGTRIGEAVRTILLDPEYEGMASRAELLLYEAARAQQVHEVIGPALKSGAVVLCDRFYDSSTAYQGYARGIPLQEVHELNMAATDSLVPDLTLLYDLPPGDGLSRATATDGADRLEAEHISFHERVAAGYRSIAEGEPDRVVIIDAAGTIDEVFEHTIAAVSRISRLAVALGMSPQGEERDAT